jgi:hypothetical protein
LPVLRIAAAGRQGDLLARINAGEDLQLALAASLAPVQSTLEQNVATIIENDAGINQQQKDELVSKEADYTDLQEGEEAPPIKTHDLSGNAALSAEKEFDMPRRFGPTKQEILQPTADAVAQALAQLSRTSTDDAKIIVDAVLANAAIMIGAAQKALRPKKKFISKDDITDNDLDDPAVLQAHIDFANQHKNTDPSTLNSDEAYKLRKARLVRKYDIDRRHMSGPKP